MSDTLQSILATLLPSPVPATATQFSSGNTTAVAAAATPQTVRAAVTDKKKWITQACAINPTTGEDAILTILADTTVLFRLPATNLAEAPAQPMAGLVVNFNPPLEVEAGAAIKVGCVGDVGDSWLSVNGFEEA